VSEALSKAMIDASAKTGSMVSDPATNAISNKLVHSGCLFHPGNVEPCATVGFIFLLLS